MLNSIVIPHRNRNEHLEICIWSILRSAKAVGVRVEVLVVENGSEIVPSYPSDSVRVIVDDEPMPSGEIVTKIGTVKRYNEAFCKARLLNIGIDNAKGDVVSIVDADAIVGAMWTAGATVLARTSVNRVAYRVRYIERGEVPCLLRSSDRESAVDAAFSRYDDHKLAWEAYGHPSRNRHMPDLQPWGNSQFSMRREDIGDLRFDEEYIGKGLEDIDFNRQVYDKFGSNFHGVIYTRGDFAMFHLRHQYDDDRWGNAAFQVANAERFTRKQA